MVPKVARFLNPILSDLPKSVSTFVFASPTVLARPRKTSCASTQGLNRHFFLNLSKKELVILPN